MTSNLLKEAEQLVSAGKLTDAELLFAKAVEGSTDSRAFLSFGDFLSETGRLAQAEKMYERAIQVSSTPEAEAEALRSLGLAKRLASPAGPVDVVPPGDRQGPEEKRVTAAEQDRLEIDLERKSRARDRPLAEGECSEAGDRHRQRLLALRVPSEARAQVVRIVVAVAPGVAVVFVPVEGPEGPLLLAEPVLEVTVRRPFETVRIETAESNSNHGRASSTTSGSGEAGREMRFH